MKENRDEINIRATADEVWTVLTDLPRHSEWNPLIYHAHGKIEPGGKIKLSAKTGDLDMTYHCTVVKVEPPQELIWKWHIVLPFLFRGEHTFNIEPIDDNTVSFVNVEAFYGLLVPFFTGMLTADGKDGMVAMDQALKNRVERSRETPPR